MNSDQWTGLLRTLVPPIVAYGVLTGLDVPSDARRSNNRSSRPLPLETSVRRVFAIDDVRSGSVKRVGAAIGEGAVVVAELHAILANDAGASR
jgi:thioredoxin reductase (NADPH)